MRQVGLLGGSFDPVHPAHIALARAALEAFHLDEVRFLPCAQQALKTHRPASPEDRCAMLRLAVADDPCLTMEASEVLRGGKTYTYDTLMALRRREPGCISGLSSGWTLCASFPDGIRHASFWSCAPLLFSTAPTSVARTSLIRDCSCTTCTNHAWTVQALIFALRLQRGRQFGILLFN